MGQEVEVICPVLLPLSVQAQLEPFFPCPSLQTGVGAGMATSSLPHILTYVSTCHFLTSQLFKGKIVKEEGVRWRLKGQIHGEGR